MQHQVYPLQFGRGLNLAAAPEAMGDGQCRVLENFRTLGSGRITTRKAAMRWCRMAEPQLAGGGAPYTGLPGVSGIVLTYVQGGESDIGGKVNLYTLDGYGGSQLMGSLDGWKNVYPGLIVHIAVLNTIVFIVDEDRKFGLTIWDPNFFLGAEGESGPLAFFQPTFVFGEAEPGESAALGESYELGESGESHQPAAPMFASFVLAHENHLWAFGYGSEADPDHPEYARFSYLGLVNDNQGSGDAGLDGRSGSANLFDVEDAVPITNRGARVVGAASAPGRMVVCSDTEPFAIYGQDRATWRKDKLDSQRGLVNSLAIGEADGAIWWASPLGFCRFIGGGRVDDVTEGADGGSIRALMNEIDLDSVLMGHQWAEAQVRFYYRRKDDTIAGCNRWVGIDYRAQTFLGDRHQFADGSRILTVFALSPMGTEKPAGLPAMLTHVLIGAHTATAVWNPGDPAPGVRTEVSLVAPDGTRLVAKLEGGASRFVHTGLSPSTGYGTIIQEFRNGATLGPIRADFTTLAENQVLGIESFQVLPSSYLSSSDEKGQPQLLPMLDVLWNVAEPNLTVVVARGGTFSGPFTEVARLAGTTIYHDKDVIAGTNYFYQLTAIDRAGNQSVFPMVEVGMAATVTPVTGIGSGLPGEGASQGIDQTSPANE